MSAAANRNVSARHLLADHARRTRAAPGGFQIFGARWLRPWIYYAVSPLWNSLSKGQIVRFPDFKVRQGMCDLYTFANLFEDYPAAVIRRALPEVELVVDLGANVGAFSLLIIALGKSAGATKPITAVEPNEENVELLRRQPFSHALEIVHAAVGPIDGQGKIIRGINSVTDRVAFAATGPGEDVRVVSLESLCDRPALVKMDIEGGEWEILPHGLPPNVRHLFLEWHPNPASDSSLEPGDLFAGDWKKHSTDLYGSTMWYLRR